MSATADQQIRRHLEALVEASRDTEGVLAAVEARRDRLRRRRRRTRALAAAAAVVLVAGLALAVTSDGEDVQVVTGPDPAVTTSPAGVAEKPLHEVDVVGVNLGTLRVATSDLRPVAHAALQHDLTLTNTGTEPAHLNDTRTSEFVGDRELLVAGELCGYGGIEGDPVVPFCHMPYLSPTIPPGGSVTTTVSLWWDLLGMAPLRSAELTRHNVVVYGPEPFTHPTQQGARGEVVITYGHLDQFADN